MQEKKLDAMQKILWDIYLILLKTNIQTSELKQIEDLIYTANKLYIADKNVIRLTDKIISTQMSREQFDNYIKWLGSALKTRKTMQSVIFATPKNTSPQS